MKKSIITLNSSLKEVLNAINEFPAGIAFVVDSSERLQGIVTDGDFRRLLLKGLSLETKITKDLLNQDYVYAKVGEKIEDLIQKTNRLVRIIPIVDIDHKPVDYFQYEHRTHFTPVASPSLHGKEFEYLTDAFLSTWISSKGKYIDRFEQDFAQYCGTAFGVATSNGTTALSLALAALEIKNGDEVIIPSLTFAATANVVLHAGAVPVMVDVEKDFWTIDPKEIRKAITSKTKAIIPVHLYGQPCDMDEIMKIAKEYDLYVIEDCAEAHGAEFNGIKVGAFGHINCFSFFANKIITTGEGGMCLTNDPSLDKKLRILRDHGMSRTQRYYHEEVGFNFRMTNLQAALGCAQLERIEEILKAREELETTYKKKLKANGIIWQNDSDTRRKRVVWLVSCLIEDRNNVMAKLQKEMIETRPFFVPLTEMEIYRKYKFSDKNALEVSKLGINFPTNVSDSHDFINIISSSIDLK
jgi:perosamine synthetase